MTDPKTVLLVDDDPDLRAMLRELVSRAGFAAAEASDGAEALEAIARRRPDAVVLDLMLPRYGGYEVLRRLQQGPEAGVPIVVVTGRYTDRSTADLISRESNVAGFLTKPVEPSALVDALRRACGSKASAGGAT